MTASAEARETALLAAQAAADKLATDVSIVDVSDRLAITDAFVLASAPNERQVQSIVDAVEERLREHGIKPVRREGVAESRWVLLDFIDVVVHVQHAEERAYYALERLWKDCPTIPFTDHAGRGGPLPAPRRPTTARCRPARGRRAGRRLRRGDDRPVSSALPELPVPRLLLWRHGRTEWNATGRFQGQLDPPLDEEGRRQAALAAPHLLAAGLPPEETVVVSSDLSRAAETAEALTALLGVPLRLDARLREHGMGSWEGLTRDEVAERYPEQFADWIAGRPIRGRGGEEAAAVAERAVAALADLPAAGVAVVVTHGGTAGRLMERLLGIDPDHRRVLGPLGNCAWSELDAPGRPLAADQAQQFGPLAAGRPTRHPRGTPSRRRPTRRRCSESRGGIPTRALPCARAGTGARAS